MTNERKANTEKLVIGAVLTALVFVLQLMGGFIRFGEFSISLVLIPIVLGAAMCGIGIGAWLGFIFGIAVFVSGDASTFLAINVPGTIITVLVKGIACGLIAGLVYKLLEKYNKYIAVIASAIVCPIVNTGVFLMGCSVFFFDALSEWSKSAGKDNVFIYMIVFFVGGNFIFELITNVILSPAVIRILKFIKKN